MSPRTMDTLVVILVLVGLALIVLGWALAVLGA